MKKEDIPFLNQLVDALEEGGEKFEEAYKKRDSEKFNRIKSFMLKVNKKISEVVK